MADFQNASGTPIPGKVTGNGYLGVVDAPLRWLAQGKVFEAGHGLQDTAADSQGETTMTPDDVKATLALQAVGNKLVVPLVWRIMWEAEGGAATDYQLIITKASAQCATKLTLSGRDALQPGLNMYRANPAKASPTASALYGVATTFLLTVSALVTADMCMYDFAILVDNNVLSPVTNSSRLYERHFLREGVPHIMTDGAAMIFYISSATTDATVHPYIQWAELDEADLI